MDWQTSIANGLALVWQWQVPALAFVGVFWGIVFGAIPGLSGTVAMAVLLPFTASLDPLLALVLLLAVYTGSMWGGAIPAILLNAPGSPAAIVTTLDGYPMSRMGRGAEALGLSIMASVLGGLIGVSTLFVVIFPLAQFTLRFGPAEMFMVAVFGLTIVASLAGRNFFKGLLAGGFGMLIGLIGLSHTGTAIATFGRLELIDGIPLIPALIGLVAFSELFLLLDQEHISAEQARSQSAVRAVLRGCAAAARFPKDIVRSGLIGVGVGALPVAGGTVASIISYNEARRSSADPERFGTGEPRGVVAAEAANNASEGGAIATMLALGIPGSSGTAVLLGAMIMQGWVPGPRLFTENADVLYGALIAEFLDMIALFLLGVLVAAVGSRVVSIPNRMLIPAIAVLTILGAYVVRGSVFDAWLLVVFGVFGLLLRKAGYPPISIVLGMILGPLANDELIRIYQAFPEGIWIVFQRPISLALLVLTVLLSLWPVVRTRRSVARNSTAV